MIFGISGLINSGKDTIADYLVNTHEFRRVSFADSLKDAIAVIFNWDRTLLEGRTHESRVWRETKDQWWSDRLGIANLTPRWVLQHWGTEVCRVGFHNDIWIASIENKLRQTKDNIVITDCRFANEIAAIKKAGGITLRVTRGPNPDWYDSAVSLNKGPKHIGWAIAKDRLLKTNIHASEYSSVGLDYDAVVENNGSIMDLHSKINDLLQVHQVAM